MVLTIEAVDVVDDLTAAVDAEVHVDIGHGDALWIQEALKKQGILDWIDIGDVETVGHNTAGGTTAAGPDRDAVALGIADKVGNDEEVVHKAHLFYDSQLIVQLPVNLRPIRVAHGKALLAELSEVGGAVALALRKPEAGQVIVAEFKVIVAAVGDDNGVVGSLGEAGEETAHLRLTLQVELLGFKAHAVRFIDRFAGLDAHEDILVIGVALFKIMGVIGHRKRNSGLPAESHQPLGDALLLGNVMVLDFQEEVLTKEFL